MLREFKKKFAVCMLVCALTVGMFSNTAYAASSTSVSGKISTGTVTGSLLMESDSATATTSFAWGGGTRYATAYVYYWWGTMYYYTKDSASSSQSGGISTTATKQLGGAQVVGAQGVHKLVYSSYTWQDTTTLGTIPPDPYYLAES